MSLIEIKFVINHGGDKPRRGRGASSASQVPANTVTPVITSVIAPAQAAPFEPTLARRLDFNGVSPATRAQMPLETDGPAVTTVASSASASRPAGLRLGNARWGKPAAAPAPASAPVEAPAPEVPPVRRPAIDLSAAATAPARYRTNSGGAIDMRQTVPASRASTVPRAASPAATAGVVSPSAASPARPVPPARRPMRRFVMWGAGAVAVVGLLIGGLVWLTRFVDGPVEASATLEQARAAAPATPTPGPPGHVQGLYLSFDYPAALELYAQVKTDASALEQFNITSKADYRQQISSSVRDLTSGNLDDDASYRFRSMHPDDYKLTSETVNGYRATLATKADKTEQTLFVVGGGRLATIAVTSTSQKATAAQVMAIIKPTIQLKR